MLKVGIVGLPNVGKSTLFSALTKKQVDCANFPFCTIEPNVGIVEVPDDRLRVLADMSKSEKVISTAIEFVDIAGLVKGASEGEGLGNKFLANIRETDMILHVVRAFEEGDVAHVDGSVDPGRDIEVIEMELMLADLAIVEKRVENLGKQLRSGSDKDLEMEKGVMERFKGALEAGKMVREVEISDLEREVVKGISSSLITMKPILYVGNVDEGEIGNGLDFGDDRRVIPLSVKIESEIAVLDGDEAKEFLGDLGLEESGLDRVIRESYGMLNLITYLTTGEKETRAWTVTKGMTGPQAAGKIHTDFEKGYIRAEVVAYEDFVACGGEHGAKEQGKLRVEGKEYVVKDGDVMHFRIA